MLRASQSRRIEHHRMRSPRPMAVWERHARAVDVGGLGCWTIADQVAKKGPVLGEARWGGQAPIARSLGGGMPAGTVQPFEEELAPVE